MPDTIEIDPESLERQLSDFLEWMRVNQYSEESARMRGASLRQFVAWCGERGVSRPGEITRPILERYQAHLFHARKTDGQPLSLAYQRIHLRAVKAFFKYLACGNRIPGNPASDLAVPRPTHQLPRYVLTHEEAERVIAMPDVRTILGLRDRAILETFYSTGIRRAELARLGLYDLDREHGTVFVRHGKGRRQRMVPIGARALAWVDRYIQEVRPVLVAEPDEGILFLTHLGAGFDPNSVSDLVARHVQASDVGKKGGAHLFRHAMATQLLEAGVDIRAIQLMLGHASLVSTQVYARVSIKRLKELHAAAHPAERGWQKRMAAEKPEAAGAATSTTSEAPRDPGVLQPLASLTAAPAQDREPLPDSAAM
jgi:integrase/recombinase XerD